MSRIFDIAAAIVTGTAAVAILTNPQSAGSFKALGDLWNGSLKTLRGS